MARKQNEQAEAARAAQQPEAEQAPIEQANDETAADGAIEGDGTGEALPPIDENAYSIEGVEGTFATLEEAEQAAIAQGVMQPSVDEGETVECAVLHDNVYGKHGEIIRLAPAIAEAARAAGYVDTHPNAIKFFRGE